MIPKHTNPPKDFEYIWSIIQSLREVKDAPVDLMGCDKVVDGKAPKKDFEFQIVVAAMLSSQTKDRYVKEAMDNLITNGLSVNKVLCYSEAEIDAMIKMVRIYSFHWMYVCVVGWISSNESEEYFGSCAVARYGILWSCSS